MNTLNPGADRLPRAHPLTLRFDRVTEQAYQQDTLLRSLRQIRMAFLLGGLLLVSGGLAVGRMDGVDASAMLVVTLAVAAANFLVPALSFTRLFALHKSLVLALPFVAFGAGAAAVIVAMPTFEMMVSMYIAAIIVLIYAFTVSRMGFVAASVVAWILLACIFGAAFTTAIPQVELYSIHTFNGYLSAALAGYFLESYMRRDFVHRAALARERELSERLRLELERELEVGRNIQRGFLPDRLPVCAGYSIDAVFTPARQVAGDFYDGFLLPEGRRAVFVIADVCGKGVGAALFMALVRSLVRVLINHNFSASHTAGTGTALAETFAEINDYIATTHESAAMFATLFAVIVDPDSHELVYVNAGHDSPVITRRSGSAPGAMRTASTERLTPTGPALGLMAGMQFNAMTTRLSPGDSLLAFTDGVSDARDANGNSFGEDRLLELAWSEEQGIADLQDIVVALAAHTHGMEAFDDITLLSITRESGG